MERVISVLIIKPNEKPIIKEMYNSKEEIARVLEIDEHDLGNAVMENFEIYFPMFLNIAYCIEKGIFPNTLIIISKRGHTDNNTYSEVFKYTNMTEDKAFRALMDINIKADEIVDRRYFFQNNTNLVDIVVNRVLHNNKISGISKALFVLVQRYNFDIFMSQITEQFKENIEIVEEGIAELIKLRVLSETIIEESSERYFTVDVTCLKEFEDIALTEYTLINKEIRNNLGEEEENTFSKIDTSEIDKDNELLQRIIDYIVEKQSASTSLIQRKFRVGYARAARLMDMLEVQGFVSAPDGSKPRKVLVNIGDV